VKLLISTDNALLYHSNGNTGVLHSGAGVYYGITWSESTLYVVARGNEPARMLAFDAKMYPKDPPPFVHMGTPGDGPHQAIYSDGVLAVANTQYNRLEMWDESTRRVWSVYPGDRFDEHDIDHLNSVWRCPVSGKWFVAEHRKALMPKLIRMFNLIDGRRVDAHIIELDAPELNAGPVRRGIHNVYAENGSIYTLGPSEIIKHSPLEETTEVIHIEGVEPGVHYLRGLARVGKTWVVGISKACERQDRAWSSSTIWALGPEFNVIETIELDERFGQVMDIRPVSRYDKAHNGIRCPLELTYA
jgi:hypothetical protein